MYVSECQQTERGIIEYGVVTRRIAKYVGCPATSAHVALERNNTFSEDNAKRNQSTAVWSLQRRVEHVNRQCAFIRQ